MSSQAEEFTIGVEEEYQIINPVTRELRSRVEHILPKAQKVLGEEVQPEAQRSQTSHSSNEPFPCVALPTASAVGILALLVGYRYGLCKLSHRDLEPMAHIRATTNIRVYI